MRHIKTILPKLMISRQASLVTALMLVFSPFTWNGTCAQETGGDLDAILSGFDDRGTEAKNDVTDDILSGFEEEELPADGLTGQKTKSKKMPEWLDITGGINLGSSINYHHDAPAPGATDHRGLSRLKTAGDLKFDIKFSKNWQARAAGKGFYDFAYRIQGRNNYTAEVLDAYEHEAEIDEMYLQGAVLGNLDLKIGRQIVTWGKSDNIRVTDILNPLDNREPGLVDIRDLRLPVTMSKIDYYKRPWNLSAIIVHEMRFNKDPVFGNDFFPAPFQPPLEEKPSTSLSNQEFALALNGIFSGWDCSLYAAYVYDDQAHFENTLSGLHRKHSRLKMIGTAVNVAAGNWLIKGESAWLDGFEFFGKPNETKSRLDVLLGLEYSGFSETVISFEVVNRHLFEFEDVIMSLPPDYAREDDLQSVLRISKDFLHDRLTLTALFATFDLTGDDGAFQRYTCKYDWSDAVSITTGLIDYQSGDKFMLNNIGDNDRIFLEVRYGFGS